MFKFALLALAAAVAVPATAADQPVPPAAPAPPPAAPAPPPAALAPPPPTQPLTPEQLANDPRMIAAIRHANAVADRKCGENVGGITDLALKAEAQRCRRRMIATAKLDAEGEIAGH